MLRFRVITITLVLLTILCLSGCGVKNAVSGRVTYEGRPALWGYVQFTPNIDKGSDGPTITLMLSNDGRFSSAEEGKSLVPGEYNVLVHVVTATGPQPPKVERRMHITIPEGGLSGLEFDIKKKKPGEKKDQEVED